MPILSNINDTYEGYQKLISFYTKNKDKTFENINLEIEGWFSANLSAALGGILDILSSNLNNIIIERISPEIERILLKNDFLSYFGVDRMEDNFHTTIQFLKLIPEDEFIISSERRDRF